MRGIGQSRVLCRGDGHGRAFSEGAEEHDAAPGCASNLTQHAAGLQTIVDIGIGRVKRPGERAVLGAFVGLTEIDQQDVWLADPRDCLAGAQREALLRQIITSFRQTPS